MRVQNFWIKLELNSIKFKNKAEKQELIGSFVRELWMKKPESVHNYV